MCVCVGAGGVLVQEEKLTLEIPLLQIHWLDDLKTQTVCCTHYVLGTGEMTEMSYHVCTGCSFPYYHG